MKPPIRYRPHHFLCSLGFEGKGYSPEFTANMTAIVMGKLRAEDGEAARIVVISEADDICAPCPSRRGQSCESAEKIEALDTAHATALRLMDGDELSWGEALNRMRTLPDDILDDICGPCQWRNFGMCAAALKRLKSQ